jgi:hypothetical protein
VLTAGKVAVVTSTFMLHPPSPNSDVGESGLPLAEAGSTPGEGTLGKKQKDCVKH